MGSRRCAAVAVSAPRRLSTASLRNQFKPLALLRPYTLREGITARAITGDRMTLAVVDLEPNVVLPEHHHENEQLGFILKGSMTFTIGGQKRKLYEGDTYAIPSDVP